MKLACIIIPYFGKLPKNIISFLLSCKKNQKIDWLIFTNDNKLYKLNKICHNVHFIKSSLENIKNRIIQAIGTKNICLNNAYKLCDYRPLYGIAFSDYLHNYKYWGYSDIDIVYGDLWKYIKYGVNHNYEKIGKHGHFTLILNNNKANSRYSLPIKKDGKSIYLFKDVVSNTSKDLAFDEGPGIDLIYKQYHIPTYVNPDLVNEVIYTNLDLDTRDKNLYKSKWQCYTWQNGHAIFYYSTRYGIKSKEYGYFHFQKRFVFTHYIYDTNISLFSIVTTGYYEINHLNINIIKTFMKLNKSKFRKRLVYKLHWYLRTNHFATRIHIGSIRLPIKYFIRTILIDKNYRIFKI